jgi:hypothetical protein
MAQKQDALRLGIFDSRRAAMVNGLKQMANRAVATHGLGSTDSFRTLIDLPRNPEKAAVAEENLLWPCKHAQEIAMSVRFGWQPESFPVLRAGGKSRGSS